MSDCCKYIIKGLIIKSLGNESQRRHCPGTRSIYSRNKRRNYITVQDTLSGRWYVDRLVAIAAGRLAPGGLCRRGHVISLS